MKPCRYIDSCFSKEYRVSGIKWKKVIPMSLVTTFSLESDVALTHSLVTRVSNESQ